MKGFSPCSFQKYPSRRAITAATASRKAGDVRRDGVPISRTPDCARRSSRDEKAAISVCGKAMVDAVAADQDGRTRMRQARQNIERGDASSCEFRLRHPMWCQGRLDDIWPDQPVVLWHPDEIRSTKPCIRVLHESRESPALGLGPDPSHIGNSTPAGCDDQIREWRCDRAASPAGCLPWVDRAERRRPAPRRAWRDLVQLRFQAESLDNSEAYCGVAGLAVRQHPASRQSGQHEATDLSVQYWVWFEAKQGGRARARATSRIADSQLLRSRPGRRLW